MFQQVKYGVLENMLSLLIIPENLIKAVNFHLFLARMYIGCIITKV